MTGGTGGQQPAIDYESYTLELGPRENLVADLEELLVLPARPTRRFATITNVGKAEVRIGRKDRIEGTRGEHRPHESDGFLLEPGMHLNVSGDGEYWVANVHIVPIPHKARITVYDEFVAETGPPAAVPGT
jgi:hypothetical protein